MRKDDRASCIHLTCSSCLIKVPPLNTPRTYFSRNQNPIAGALLPRLVQMDKSSTDNYAFINKIGAVWRFFYRRMNSFLLASLVIKLLGVLLTCYSLLEPPLFSWKLLHILTINTLRAQWHEPCYLGKCCSIPPSIFVCSHFSRFSLLCYTGTITKQINMEGGQSGTYLRLMRASSGLRVSVTKTYKDETKLKCEYFGQITVAFLSNRIQETEAKFF